MIDRKTLGMIWALLLPAERRNFWIVASIVLLSAVATVIMVMSIMPFLAVLADPSRIQGSSALSTLYAWGGFEDTYAFLLALGAMSIVVILVANLLQLFKVYVISRFSAMRVYSISTRLLETYLRKPFLFFANRHTSELGKQLMSESQQVVDLAIKPAIETFSAFVTMSMIVCLLVFLEPVITIATFLTIGVVYGGVLALNRRSTKRLGEIRKTANAECFKIVNDAMAGIKDLKVSGRERFYLNLFSKPAHRMARSQLRIALITQSPQYVIHAVMFSGIISLCLALLLQEGMNAESGLSDIFPTIGLMAFAGQRMLPELSRLFRSVTMLGYAGPAVEAVHADLALGVMGRELPNEGPKPLGLKSSLQFERLSFRYPDTEHSVLSEVSFSIAAGERIGIVGSTGSGKTTLANIILGLTEATAGSLIVDGNTIDSENVRAWQQSIGYVAQDIFLTDLSVRENIAFGVPVDHINETRVVEVAKIAQIHDFILTDMPDSYETIVGERGVRLSGGQRQRIGIARSLYSKADLVLFDEATSALDNATEKDVMRSIGALPGDTTLIMIAHRLSTLRGCDRILVLNRGEVAGFGSWELLQAECEEFQKLSYAK